ncbi:Phycocyanin [[Leptolyngbya] sp. PCC 7376]|uniref:phycocyanin n=1 Tax=[Leptolyngbya] sp. PCC 7376 TaxID=111781 RepID=UPI00029F17DE|nr:phycocyanin [[Leptolyngbya] sp. PCC 7376]AFY37061.1 Phycocyanin [[Leptolyngbya] sp. PCC 7376]
MLSPKVKELITKARIVSFETWTDSYPPELIAVFQAADDESRYLTDADFEVILQAAPSLEKSAAIAKSLRDNATNIVSQARVNVLAEFPGITDEGGELYPAFRADACWRDFWHFLRCVTYGITTDRTDYTSKAGLGFMEQLYQELKVPLPAMLCGIQGLKTVSLSYVEKDVDIKFAQSFDHLLTQLQQFSRR